VGELEPVEEGAAEISPEAALVRELRTLFDALRVSQNRYAARVYLDKSVLSRYLSGERIPRWDFVHQLLVESTLKNDGVAPTPDVVKHLRTLHRSALESGGSPNHKIQLLQEDLAEADAQAQRADRRERELEQALHEAQRHMADLEVRSRELENELDRQRDDHAAALVSLRDAADAQRQALIKEIERLTHELELAQQRRIAAETRCVELEHRLEHSAAEPQPDAQETRPGAVESRDGEAGIESPSDEPVVGTARRRRRRTPPDPDATARAMVKEAVRLSRMNPAEAVRELRLVPDREAVGILQSMLIKKVVELVKQPGKHQAGQILSLLEPHRAILVLQALGSPADIVEVATLMKSSSIVATLDLMDTQLRDRVVGGLPTGKAADVIDMVEPARAAVLLAPLSDQRIAGVLELVDPSVAGQILECFPQVIRDSLFTYLDPEMQDWIRVAQSQPK